MEPAWRGIGFPKNAFDLEPLLSEEIRSVLDDPSYHLLRQPLTMSYPYHEELTTQNEFESQEESEIPASEYGGWIGGSPDQMYTADWVDTDGDDIDDRWQEGPGLPDWRETDPAWRDLLREPAT